MIELMKNYSFKTTLKNLVKGFVAAETAAPKLFTKSLDDWPFFDIATLCAYLGITPLELQALCNCQPTLLYHRFYIDKATNRIVPFNKTANLRMIEAPRPELKEYLMKLIPFFEKFPIHKCNYAFIRGKKIKDAVESVKEGEVLIHTDLKDFFTEHTPLYIKSKLEMLMLQNVPEMYDPEFCKLLTRLITVYTHLPQGSPCSPIITAIINYDMDSTIQSLADEYNLTYMRYADDICFSGTIANDDIRVFLDKLVDAVHPFRLNRKKVAIMRDAAYPVFSGLKLYIENDRQYIPSSLLGKLIKLVRHEFEPMEFTSVHTVATQGKIHFKLGKIVETPVGSLKEKCDSFSYHLNSKYSASGFKFKLKPTYFYIKSLKQVLGMHITDGKICYPRKMYNQLRLEAMLVGRQLAFQFTQKYIAKNTIDPITSKQHVYLDLQNFVDNISDKDDPMYSRFFTVRYTNVPVGNARNALYTISSRSYKLVSYAEILGINPTYLRGKKRTSKGYRNMLDKPVSLKVFYGKVNWVNTVDPEKATKLKEIVKKYKLKTLVALVKAFQESASREYVKFSAV